MGSTSTAYSSWAGESQPLRAREISKAGADILIVGNLLQTEDFGKTLREISLETKRAIARRFLRSSTSAGGVLPAQHRFKPMNFPLAGMRRVQVGSFVLLYSIDEQRRTVVLEDYDYRRE